MNTMRNLLARLAAGLLRLRSRTDRHLFFGGSHFCHRKARQRKGKGMQEKAPVEDTWLCLFLYEPVAPTLSTTSTGEPFYQVRDKIQGEELVADLLARVVEGWEGEKRWTLVLDTTTRSARFTKRSVEVALGGCRLPVRGVLPAAWPAIERQPGTPRARWPCAGGAASRRWRWPPGGAATWPSRVSSACAHPAA
jgi:hypothetical protein